MSIGPRNRDYTQPVDMHQQVFLRGWADNGTNTGIPGTTGLWRALALDQSGRMQVAIDNVTFSGQINVDDVQVTGGYIAVTGGTINVALTGTTFGNVNSTPSGYQTQTGLFQVGALAVVTSGYNPQYASGAKAAQAIDNQNGGVLAVMSDLDKSCDNLVSYVPSATTTSNYLQSGNPNTYAMVTGNVLLSNPNRVQSYIQNLGSGVLFVKLGSAPCSTGSFSFLLKGSSAVGAGYGADGGLWSDNGFWQGDVSVSGQTFFAAWEA